MPLYVADYLADAAHLSTLEHGAYLLLIMTYWQRGEPLPASSERLARVARVSNEEWAEMHDVLSEFFHEIDGEWRHKRIDAELEKVHDKSQRASNAGKASAQRRLNRRSADKEQTFNHTDTDTDTDTELEKEKPTVSHKSASKTLRGERLPDDWFPEPADCDVGYDLGFSEDEIRFEHAKFTDYWRAKPGKDGRKADWNGTFRNWLRKASDGRKNGSAPVQRHQDRFAQAR
jgi:uncharacterized protein YdaU (DUF1376 family)